MKAGFQELLSGRRPALMGILNVTPDSFSDSGQFYNRSKAIERGLQMLEEGADIIDVGGESTRPGAEILTIEEEAGRVLPVIEGLAKKAQWISVDTRHAPVMQAALAAGANIINDISALTHDPSGLELVAKAQVPVILMHMRGTPQTMQKNPNYQNVVEEVFSYLKERIDACRTAGIEKKSVVVDPGIGFGKTLEHNLLLLRNLRRFLDLECAVMLGASRKSFIEKICPGTGAESRLPGSLAAALWGASQGVRIVRVHDVKETKQALDIWQAITPTF